MNQRRAVVRSLLAGGAVLTLGAGDRSVAASSAACPASPEETAGPFPADGSDLRDQGPGPPRPPGSDPHGPGPPPPGAIRPGPGPGPPGSGRGRNASVPNILAAPGIVRRDIRASFDTSSTVAAGVPLRLELTLLDISRGCRPLADSAVYVWSCNRDGDYSLYGRGIEHENYLRGVQFTDRDGRVAFATIFPACYSGRYPHLHLEIFKQGARSLDAATRVLTTQLTAPREVCARVYATAPGYARSAAQFKGMLPSEDMVFASSSPAELTLQTLAITGDSGAGFSGQATLGIRA
jgi:protocatechuate 3,4-dioxygenase beta subunit